MKLLAALLFGFFTTSALADQSKFPALYDVTDVATDDVLNVRQSPGASYPVIGVLNPNATDIEVVRLNDTATWALVNVAEQSGWVSLSFMRRQAKQSDTKTPAITSCFGTEPFWSLSFDDQPKWSVPGQSDPVAITEWQPSRNLRDRYAITGKMTNSQGVGFKAVVRRKQCSDGMSDRAYALDADLIWQGPNSSIMLYSGCCTIAP